ncbi:MAG: putative DNA binding domain-containing protein [Bacilli bacterium]|nr:putative DNA binding domain-containing protein [Bacilli bacterium]MBP3921328.1 putative DNA binding domain-containing protein [Bacilli bacterium]
MYKNNEELNKILEELLKNQENECVEFKRAENNFDIDNLGKYFSALGNEANLKNKQYSWIIFGVDDKTHELTNTNFYKDGNFNKVKKQISDNTTDNMSFIEIYEVIKDDKRVIMFQVPAASGTPINWKGFPYGRNGESITALAPNKIEQIKATANYDWSRQIIEKATIDNLDKDAIKLAREQFKVKYKGKIISDEIDKLSDIDFLNKAKLTLDNKITMACMLLLGKNDDDYLMNGYTPRMTWKLYDEFNVIDYEHFGIPFISNVEKLKAKIRNLRYRYMVNDNTLFPNEVDQYDNYILRELINNCIVHQDYRFHGNINVMEYKDKLIITNEGSFIPETIENVLKDGFSSPYYRNQFLANAMVNLNMIDTVGSGIRRVYDIQKKKFFPMPDYDLSESNRVKVTLYGKIIDEKYSKILFEKTNLDIDEVMLLDRVQKGYQISKEKSDYLRKENLIEGRYPNIYISSNIAKITNKEKEYIDNKGLDNAYYKDYILSYIEKFGKATREEINNFIYPKLPASMNEKNKNNRVRYILSQLKKENKIRNDGSDSKPCWVIIK